MTNVSSIVEIITILHYSMLSYKSVDQTNLEKVDLYLITSFFILLDMKDVNNIELILPICNKGKKSNPENENMLDIGSSVVVGVRISLGIVSKKSPNS